MADDEPQQRPVTREGQAENDRKQAVYAARRRAWTERQLRRDAPEPDPPRPEPAPAEDRVTGPARPQRGRMIHDKRQGRLDL